MTAQSARLGDDVLADIQGFISSGYGHLSQAAYLFVQCRDADRAREWLRRLLPAITSARAWPVGPDGKKIKPSVTLNIAFTAPGLAALGLPQAVLSTFPPEFQEGIAHPGRSRILGDTEESDPLEWELGGPRKPAVHALLIVHAESAAGLETALVAQRAAFDDTAGAVVELPDSLQTGYRPRGDYEPFGFHDGIAQPSIAGITGEGVPTGEFILGYPNHYQIVPPVPVTPAESDLDAILPPLANPHHASPPLRDLGVNGSFVVYRKLRQDVAGFWQFMKQEALRMTGAEDSSHMIRLASKCVGRWPSGASLILAPETDDPQAADRDDFTYGGDPDGLSCPVGAHVRRTHPRDVIKPYGPDQSLSMSEAHRLLRRARVFGPTVFEPAALTAAASAAGGNALPDVAHDGQERGIHFFCVNASIKSQFEFVQQNWSNNPRFGGLNDNKDPIVGDNARADQAPSSMTIPGRPFRTRTSALPRFVTVRAGAYLFMPSLAAVRFLSAMKSTD